MRKNLTLKKLLLYVCICLIALSGCHKQLEKGLDDMLFTASSQAVLQIPKAHTEHTDTLDEGQWLADDDAASHVSMHNKKILPVRRDLITPALLLQALLAGLVAMLAYAVARVYHNSSCPTRGLSRMLSFILDADGEKENNSFRFVW